MDQADAQGGDKTLDSALCAAYHNVDRVGHRLGIVFRWISNRLPDAHMTNWSRLGRDTPPIFGDYEAQRHWIERVVLARQVRLSRSEEWARRSLLFSFTIHHTHTKTTRRGRLFTQLGAVTIASFTILFLPFLPPFASPSTILDPIARIPPFSRGLFEDKVANFRCFSNVALKWRNIASPGTLVRLSTLFTTAGFVPGVPGLLRAGFNLRIKEDSAPSATLKVLIEKEVSTATEAAPSTGVEGDKGQEDEASTTGPLFPLLLLSMLASSISFLFSFQVHEKTILVPLLPLTLIMVGASGNTENTTWELGMLTNNVAVFR